MPTREQVIEQIRQNLAATLATSVEYVEPEEFAIFRQSDSTLHFRLLKSDGSYETVTIDQTVESSGEVGSGGGSYEVATESPADGMNDTFTFTGPPTLVFRNGVMELRKGSVVGSTFVFDVAPGATDDIEGLV